MNDKEFFAQFDDFSGDVIAKLREALAITIKDLKSSNSEISLMQVETLRIRTARRLGHTYGIEAIIKPEEHVTKVHAVVIAVVNYALDDAKEFILSSDKAIFGSEEDGKEDDLMLDAKATAETHEDRSPGEERERRFQENQEKGGSGWAG